MKSFSFALVLFFLVTFSFAFSANRIGPVSQYGQLITGKNSNGKGQIYGSCQGVKDGSEVQVKGMSLYWSLMKAAIEFWNEEAISTMVKDMKIQIVRAAMATGREDWQDGYKGYELDPNTQRQLVTQVVEAAIKNDIYVIIDWHSHEANNQIESAKAFFSEMAQKYGEYDNVIFELFNEPQKQSWDEVKNYANQIIPVIRKYSDNLILVGNPFWDQTPNSAINKEVTDSKNNTAYTFHYYAGTHKIETEGKNAIEAMNAGLSVFVSEWGTGTADGKGDVSSSNEGWQNWLNTHKLSWANWSASKINEGSAAFNGGSANNLQFSKSGEAVKGFLNNNPTTYTACKIENSTNEKSSSSSKITSSSSSSKINVNSNNFTMTSLIDDIEDGDKTSKWGGDWFEFSDQNSNGQTTTSISIKDGNNSSKAITLNFNLNKGNYEYNPFAGFGVYLKSDISSVDMTQCKSIKYDYKGSAHRIRIESPINEDYAYFGINQESSNSWKTVTLTWSDFSQPENWGESKDLNEASKKVTAISFQYEGENGFSGELSIDNLYCEGLTDAFINNKVIYKSLNLSKIGNTLNLNNSKSGNIEIKIFDILGNSKLNIQKYFNKGEHKISIQNLPKGTYITKVKQENNTNQILFKIK